MDYTLILTAIGSIATVVGLVYAMIRNFRQDMDKRFTEMDGKFDKKFDSIFTELRHLRTDVQDLKGDVREMKGEMKWIFKHDKAE